MKLFHILTLFSYVHTFTLTGYNKPRTNFKFVGDTAPLGYFDPLNVLNGVSEEEIKLVREAELKHGRIAMIAAASQPILEYIYHKPFINILFDSGKLPNYLFFVSAGVFEIMGMVRAWQNPFDYGGLFSLKDEHEPGWYLQSKKDAIKDTELMEKELNNGRLAMIAIAYTIGQETIKYYFTKDYCFPSDLTNIECGF